MLPCPQKKKNETFEKIPQQTRDLIEKYLIGLSLKTNDSFEEIFDYIGKNEDADFVNYLEKKYGQELNTLKLAVEVNKLSHAGWELKKIFKWKENYAGGLYYGYLNDETKEQTEKIENILKNGLTLIQEIIKYQVVATHATYESAYESIQKDQRIYASSDRDQYHGKGLYAGFLGSFRGWSSHVDKDDPQRIIKFNVNLRDCFVNHQYRGYLINILCDYIKMDDVASKKVVKACGLIEWRQHMAQSTSEELLNWKLDLLNKTAPEANFSLETQPDDNQDPIFVFKNESFAPIQFSFLCNALDIERCMSMEMYKREYGAIKS